MPVPNEAFVELVRVQSRNSIAAIIMQEAGRLATARGKTTMTQEETDDAAFAFHLAMQSMKKKGLWLDAKPDPQPQN
jgi:hypothetical protein